MERTLKIIFILTLIALALGDLGRIQLENGIAIAPYDIGVGALFLAWFLSLKWKKKNITCSLLKPILIFAGVGLISLIVNLRLLALSDFAVSLLYLVRWIFYAGIYFVVGSFDTRFKKHIPVILIFVSFFLIVVPGFVQYFLYPNLRNIYYLGWDEHLYRLVSTFLDPNFTASVLSLLLILILATRPGRIGFILTSFAFVALLLTYSRSGYLMFFVGIASLLFLLNKKKYLLGLFAVLIFGLLLLPKNLGGEGVKLLRTASFFNRIEATQRAITIIKDNSILGVGFNSYRYAQYRYGFIKGENWRTTHSGAGTDNSFLFVLATTGIVGLISYLCLWLEIIKKVYQTRSSNIISLVVLASSFGIAVNAFFLNSLFYPFIMAWMWILLGLTENS